MTKSQRRAAWSILCVCALLGGVVVPSVAQDPPTNQPATNGNTPAAEVVSDADKLITEAGKQAIEKGLEYLAKTQNQDGSFGSRSQGNYATAMTGLSGMAFIAGGHLPGRGRYGDHVVKAIKYLLSVQGDTGFYASKDDQSRIHGHGYATEFLAQTLGTINDRDLQDRVRRSLISAVKLIENSQTKDGGWGYEPDDKTWDEASTTVTMVQGLRAARDAGISVQKKTIEMAVRYVHRCAMRVDWVDKDGKSHVGYTFRYSLTYPAARSTFPLTAAAVTVLHGTGRYEGEVLQGGIDWLNAFYNDHMADKPNEQWYERFFFYSHFYAAQAMFHATDSRYWDTYFPKIRDMLIKKQNKSNGSWPSPVGEMYGSAIAVLILQIPYGYLPIFQK